ncbi:MAG: hypothetical protein V4621_02305 [Pseudomonadota bacterium]
MTRLVPMSDTGIARLGKALRIWMAAGLVFVLTAGLHHPAFAACYIVNHDFCHYMVGTGTTSATGGPHKVPGDTPPPPGSGTEQVIKTHFYEMRDKLEKWMYNDFADMITGAMKKQSQQLTQSQMQSSTASSAKTDALVANRQALDIGMAHSAVAQDLMPDVALCRDSSAVRTLVGVEAAAEGTQNTAANRMATYHSYTAGSTAARGEGWEKQARIATAVNRYIDPRDHGGAVKGMGVTDQGGEKNLNADMDFAATLGQPMTVETTRGGMDDVMALSKNLYGNDMFYDINPKRLDSQLFDLRQIQAKRNVLLNSFMAQVGLKAKGHTDVTPQTLAAFQKLGLPQAVIDRDLKGRPSYYALMDVITKRQYQDANFYTNLIKNPAAQDRTSTTAAAFANMQMRDMTQSLQRQETLYAMLLELRLLKRQAVLGAQNDRARAEDEPK